jgi:hypothetical protein
MASLTTVCDATQPMDTGNGIAKPSEPMESGWQQIQRKRSSLNNISKERLESMRAAMKQTKVTVALRVAKDTGDDYSAAETHLNIIRELSKQDSNLVVLDHKGINHVNIHKAFSEEKYKEAFNPREKTLPNGTIQVSVAHHVLSETENFNKTLLIPFLKKNHAYIHFNQKDGLEHFSAIGVLFGPHPELSWRDDLVDKIEKTIKAEISEEECKKINTSLQQPKIVISMTPQTISNPKHNNTKSIALEIRVPAEHETVYINILDRLNERASTLQEGEVDLVLDEGIGVFFPYYAKRIRPNLFDALMKKQNTEMHDVSAIPIFGLTPAAAEFPVMTATGKPETVNRWIHNHPNVLKMEKTASSKDLGKYMLIVERDSKEEVDEFLENLFDQIPDNFQPGQFPKPQRGGNVFKTKRTSNIKNYLDKLEEQVQSDLLMYDEESISTTPPSRPRRMTISYAQATRRLSFQHETTTTTTANKAEHSTATIATSMSTLTHSSLEAAMSKIRAETESAINKLRQEFHNEVQSMETKIANAVIEAIRSTPPMESMDTENTDAISTQSSQTAATVKTLTDKYDSLHSAMIMLTERVSELAEIQTQAQLKRNRPLDTPPKFRLPPATNSPKSVQQSPPTKVPRAEHFDRSTTPPPNGTPIEGAQEGQ